MRTAGYDNRIMQKLSPKQLLLKLADPDTAQYRFRAKTVSEARQWQRKTSRQLTKVLGFQDLAKIRLSAKVMERIDKGDYVREKLLIHTSKHLVMPVYLLIPKQGGGPFPVVLALHGHGYGVKDIVGLWEDGRDRHTPSGIYMDYAVTLCRRGFAVAAPEISCFGERQVDFSYLNTAIGEPVPKDTCTYIAMIAFHLGKSVIGLRVFEGKRLVDYLETRTEFDTTRLGAMGLSGGGVHAFFSTALDPRIRACVVSGAYSTFSDSHLSISRCACNYVPGMHIFGEMHDLTGLIAPRPMLVEAASRDPISPIASVKKNVARARRIYRIFDAEDDLVTDYFEGRHQISGRKAYDFLSEKL